MSLSERVGMLQILMLNKLLENYQQAQAFQNLIHTNHKEYH